MGGTTASMSSVSLGDVKKRKTTPPTMEATKRSPIEMFTLTVFWRTVVSEARRLVSSPVLLRVEEGDLLLHQPGEEIGAELRHHALAGDGEEREAQRRAPRPPPRAMPSMPERVEIERGRRPAPAAWPGRRCRR